MSAVVCRFQQLFVTRCRETALRQSPPGRKAKAVGTLYPPLVGTTSIFATRAAIWSQLRPGAKRRRTAADQQRRSPFTTIRSLFAADHQLLHHQYDFICCFRVFEHFRTPAKEWSLIETLLKPGGWLAISTPLLTSLTAFAKWHYKNNPTHVSFYQQQTFAYLASQGKFKLIFAAQDFILMQKTSGSAITRDLDAEPPLVD